MTTIPIQRSRQMMVQPVRLDRAFEDPVIISKLIEKGAPYKTITAVQKNPANNDTPGWFRNFWALGSKVIFDGAEAVFHNPFFIEAAKQSFQAEIIQPLAMMTNLNVPAPEAPMHLDLPFFRGAHQREVPNWILAPMGYSGLFQPWAIPVASAISWFYPGTGGDFEYWPEGLDSPRQTFSSPCVNRAVIADNEYMYHRVGQMGDGRDYLAEGLSSDCLLHLEGGSLKTGRWAIRQGDQLIRDYAAGQIRISVLWKAYCFRNQFEADAFADPAHNLTPTMIVDIFCRDLQQRGVHVTAPSDLETDKAWMSIIERHYNAPEGSAY